MDVSSRPPTGRRPVSCVRTHKSRWLLLLVGFLAVLLGLSIQALGIGRDGDAVIAHGAPITHFDASPTTAAGPPTLTLSVPSTGQGPVGAHMTIIGSNWGNADVLIGVAAPGGSCNDPNSWAQTFNHVRPQSDGSIIFTFDWPNSLAASGSAYSICAINNAGGASASYLVSSTSQPTLTVNPTTTNAGSIVTISGANFVGSGNVTLSVTSAQGGTHELTTLSPNGSGGFDLTYQPRPTDLGDVTIRAFTSAPQGMRPALDQTVKLHVDPALTPTPGVTPTVTVVPSSTGGDNNATLMAIMVVVAGVLLALLVVASVAFFIMRKRGRPAGGADYTPGYPGGSGPGYGGPGNVYNDAYQGGGYGGTGNMGNPGWDAPTQGYSTYHEDGYPPQTGYGEGSSGWQESDMPDPDWRPRPMTGQWHAPDGYADAPYNSYGAGANENYPPQDPWASPENSYGPPGQSYGVDQRYGDVTRGSNRSPYDHRGRGAGGEPRRDPGDTYGDPRGDSRGGSSGQPPDDDW